MPATKSMARASNSARSTELASHFALHSGVGNLLGSLVGQSESDIRQALELADAMAPCILLAAEIEKGLAGATSASQTDSGVKAARGAGSHGSLLPSCWSRNRRASSGALQPTALDESQSSRHEGKHRAHARRIDLGDGCDNRQFLRHREHRSRGCLAIEMIFKEPVGFVG